MTSPTKQLGFEERVSQYVQLRAKRDAMKKAHAEAIKPFNTALDGLEGILLSMLQDTKQESARTNAGTVYKTVKKSASIADGAAFRRHIIGGELWDLVDWRANAPAIAAYIEDTKEAPPGVNFSTHVEVGVRKS